jgi:hypothetical protein
VCRFGRAASVSCDEFKAFKRRQDGLAFCQATLTSCSAVLHSLGDRATRCVSEAGAVDHALGRG